MILQRRSAPAWLIRREQVTDDGTSAGVDVRQHPPGRCGGRGWRPQAGDVQRAELLPGLGRGVRGAEPGDQRLHRRSSTATTTRSRSTPATPNGPRGAWDDTNLRRQRSKIVKSHQRHRRRRGVAWRRSRTPSQFGDATATTPSRKLVAALNTDAGQHPLGLRALAGGRRPAAAGGAGRDPHRASSTTPHTVSPVGASKVLVGNAGVRQRSRAAGPGVQGPRHRRRRRLRRGRQPLQVQGLRHRRPATVNATTATAGLQRRPQAPGQRRWSPSPTQFAADRGIERIFLVGDFNAYSEEDPVQEIERARQRAGNGDDYHAVDDPDGDESYSFCGLSGLARPRLRQRRRP